MAHGTVVRVAAAAVLSAVAACGALPGPRATQSTALEQTVAPLVTSPPSATESASPSAVSSEATPLGLPAPEDPRFPSAIYPPAPAPAKPAFLPAGFTGGCPNPAGLDVLIANGEAKQDPAAYAAAIDGAMSPYERSDRALWPAIAASAVATTPATQHVDPNNVRVGWVKSAPASSELLNACGFDLFSFSTAVEIGLNALPDQHGWAYFVSRHGHLLVYGVQKLAVVGPWVLAPPAPGEVIDTSGFTLAPRVVLDTAQLRAVLGGHDDVSFAMAATPDFVVIARESYQQTAGQLTAIGARTGAVAWQAPLAGCGNNVAASANTVWVFSTGCDPKGTVQGDPFVARYDAKTGRREQEYGISPTWLAVDGDTAWATVTSSDNARTFVLRLDAAGATRIATLDGYTYGWAAPLVASNGRLHVTTRIDRGQATTTEFYELRSDTGALLFRQSPPFDGQLTPTSTGVIASVRDEGEAAYDVAHNALGPRFARNSQCLGGAPGTLWCLHGFQTTGTKPVLLSYDVTAAAITNGAELEGRWPDKLAVSGTTAFVESGGKLLAFDE